MPPIEFVMSIPHSAEKDVVYHHAKRAVWFPTGRPISDAALGAELSRLACIRLETSFGFEQDRIRKVLARVGFTDCQFFENSVDSDGRVPMASLRRSNRTTVAPQSWFSSHFAAVMKDDAADLAHDFSPGPSRSTVAEQSPPGVLLQRDQET